MMRQWTCRWETQVRLGHEPDIREFREHLSNCAQCQESLAVRAWLQNFAALPLAGSPPPDPSFLWLKGQILRRWEKQRRSTLSMERMQVSLGALGVMGLFAWLWRQLQGSPLSAPPLPLALGADFSRALPAILVLSLAMLIITLFITARDLVTE
jgi:hypothetical protein